MAMTETDFPATANFPVGGAGRENLGLGDNAAAVGTFPTTPVKTSSVDSTFATLPIVDMLLVDTEGNDPLVLLGSADTLKRTRYVEFEYSDLRPWLNIDLNHVINYLDNLGFVCFWMTKKAELFLITRCISETAPVKHTWANVGCINHRDKLWWPEMKAHYLKGKKYA